MDFPVLPLSDPAFFVLFILLPGLSLIYGLNLKIIRARRGSDGLFLKFIESIGIGFFGLFVEIIVLVVYDFLFPQLVVKSSFFPIVAGTLFWISTIALLVATRIAFLWKTKSFTLISRNLFWNVELSSLAMSIGILVSLLFLLVLPVLVGSPLFYKPGFPASISTITGYSQDACSINFLISNKANYPLTVRGLYRFDTNSTFSEDSKWELIPNAPLIISPYGFVSFLFTYKKSQTVQGFLLLVSEDTYPIPKSC